LAKQQPQSLQVIATTHAPLVLASAETVWQSENDRLFDLDLNENNQVVLEDMPFEKHGNAVSWLTSDSFDLETAYSVAAERAMERADALMRQYPDPAQAPAKEKERIHRDLRGALGGDDEYWPNWTPYYEHGKGTA
jgi:hypothetical protein